MLKCLAGMNWGADQRNAIESKRDDGSLGLNVDLNMVEKIRREAHPPWIGDNMENIITRIMAVPLHLKPNWSKPSKRSDCKSSRECTLTDL
jgi:hypothetical protein